MVVANLGKNLLQCQNGVLALIYEKQISAEIRLIHAEQMPLYNFVILREKNRHR